MFFRLSRIHITRLFIPLERNRSQLSFSAKKCVTYVTEVKSGIPVITVLGATFLN